jgi:hypothetical protein
MKHLLSVLALSLAAVAAGCLSPDGFVRPNGGTVAGQGGAPAATGSGGSALGGSPGASGGSPAQGGSVGSGGAIGHGGSLGTGGAIVTTGTGGHPQSGTGGAPPPPPSGTQVYSDDFESDTVGAPAVNWIQDTIDSDTTKGTFSVVSDNGNKVLQGAANSSDFIMDIGGNSAWTDYTFQVDIKMMSGSSFELGVFGRFALGSDKGNYYEAYMDDSGAVQLRVKLDGSTTTLGTKSKSTTGAAVLGMVYTFTLDLRGSTISVSVNGVPRVSMVMDSTLSAGGIGLIVNNGTAEFDNVVVTE